MNFKFFFTYFLYIIELVISKSWNFRITLSRVLEDVSKHSLNHVIIVLISDILIWRAISASEYPVRVITEKKSDHLPGKIF